MDMIFPPYDERAQRAGDRRSGVTGSDIDKIVSQEGGAFIVMVTCTDVE